MEELSEESFDSILDYTHKEHFTLVPRKAVNSHVQRKIETKLQSCGWGANELYPFSSSTNTQVFHQWMSELILSSIESKFSPVHFLIRGEPSAGKTTELRRVIHSVVKKAKETGVRFYPLYSELQYSRTGTDEGNDTIWNDIVSGSVNKNFRLEEYSKTFEDFTKHMQVNEIQPIIFIDTLDIMLLKESVKTAERWSTFLEKATDAGVPLVWTCRPYEWRTFEPKIAKHISRSTVDIELPQLNRKVMQRFPPITEYLPGIDPSNLKFVDAWADWTLGLQVNVPLFANRFLLQENDKKHLNQSFILQLAKVFESYYFDGNIREKSPLEMLESNLPTSHYYSWLFDSILLRLKTSYELQPPECEKFRVCFEKSIQAIANENLKGLRLVFSISELRIRLESQGFDLSQLNSILNVCESYGLIQQHGRRFEFTHQLLFEEILFKSESSDFDQYPSIQVRNLTKRDTESNLGPEFDENFTSLIHWTGAILSYHPDVRFTGSDLPTAWNPWIAYSREHLPPTGESESGPILTPGENTEKRAILEKFLTQKGTNGLFLNGAPGTGKTYFCFNFLGHHLTSSRFDTIDWRYVTLSEPLVDHFDREWGRYKKDKTNYIGLADTDTIHRVNHSTLGAVSVGEILEPFLPHLVKNPDLFPNSTQKFGILGYRVFRNLLNSFYEIKQPGAKRPATGDAWHDFRNLWHDQFGKRLTKPESRDGRIKSEQQILQFHSFVESELSKWKILENACIDAINVLGKMDPEQRSLYQHDLLMIDEVQDLSPSVLAFILCLTRDDFDSKRILVAGDSLQTVNRSGFEWKHFREETHQCLQKTVLWLSQKKLENLSDIVMNLNRKMEIETLRTPWRNAPKITKFNDSMRQSFGEYYGTTFEDYEVEPGQPSAEILVRDKHAKITFCICPKQSDFEKIIKSLQSIESEITETSNVAVITPYEHLEPTLSEFRSFPMFTGESVKGLEFDGIIVAQPYELLSDEAASAVGLGGKNSAKVVETRIKKWFESDTPESEKLRELFHSLYGNIRTRMNVVFSRPKLSLLVLLRNNLGHGLSEHEHQDEWVRNTQSFDLPNPHRMDSSPWSDTLDIQILHAETATLPELKEALYLPENIGDTSTLSRIQRAIQAEQMKSGSDLKNIVNQWRSYLENRDKEMKKSKSPLRSASILSGAVDLDIGPSSPPTILHGLRNGIIKPDMKVLEFTTSSKYICERFLQSLVVYAKPVIEGGRVSNSHTLPYNIYSDMCRDLPHIVHEVLHESLQPEVFNQHPQITETLLSQIFGIEVKFNLSKDSRQKFISKEFELLLDPELVKENEGLVGKIQPLNFDDISPKITDFSGLITLDSTDFFDSILLFMIQNIDAPFIERCLAYFDNTNVSHSLDVWELNSSFWELGAEIKSKEIGNVFKSLGPFLESITRVYSLIPVENGIPSVPSGDIKKKRKPEKTYHLQDSHSGASIQLDENAFSRCLLHWIDLCQNLTVKEHGENGRIIYHLHWFMESSPSSNMLKSLLKDWADTGEFEPLIQTWWDQLIHVLGVKIRKPTDYYNDIEQITDLLGFIGPTLELLEIRKVQNPSHLAMQRICLSNVLSACFAIVLSFNTESNRKVVWGMLNELVKGNDFEYDSLFERYNLAAIVTPDLSTKFIPMYALLSLYDSELKIQDGIKLLLGGGIQERPFEENTRKFFEICSNQFSDSVSKIDMKEHRKNYLQNFKTWSNAMYSREFAWWKTTPSKSVPLEKENMSHWMRFLQCASYLKIDKPLIIKSKPHPWLPQQLGSRKLSSLLDLSEEMQNSIDDIHSSLKMERKYRATLRMALRWLNSGLQIDKGSQQFQLIKDGNPNTRGLLVSVLSEYYSQRHFVDWNILYVLSTSKNPSSDRMPFALIPFGTILSSLAEAFSYDEILAHPLVGKIVSGERLTIEESILLLNLAKETRKQHADQLSAFIAILENPYHQLGEIFATPDYSVYRDREIWSFSQDSTFFSGPFAKTGGAPKLNQLYVQHMLDDFVKYLFNYN